VKQNPYSCGDGGCVLRVPGLSGQHTNAGCRCIPLKMTPNEHVRLRKGIRWLAERLAKTDDLLDEGHTIVNDHLGWSWPDWLGRVEALDDL